MLRIAVGCLIVAVIAIEVGRGFSRLRSLRAEHRTRLLDEARTRHSRTARSLEDMLERTADHCVFLARSSMARSVLDNRDAAGAAVAVSDLTAYLLSFSHFDRIQVLDDRGIEKVRIERQSRGAAVLAGAQLDGDGDPSMLTLARSAPPLRAACSNPVWDATRVEVASRDRLVVRHAAEIDGEEPRGVLVITTYAAPLIEHAALAATIPGAIAVIVDATYHAITGLPVGDAREAVGDDGVLLTETIVEAPKLILAGLIPKAALDRAAGSERTGRTRLVVETAITTLLLAILGVLFVRGIRRDAAERERRNLEKRLETAERLSALGMMTAGVAHEINNPLEGIGNYLSLLERTAAGDEDQSRRLKQIRHGFDRIRDIVRDLLAFARPPVSFDGVDVARVVDAAWRLIGYGRGFEGVVLDVSKVPEDLKVIGDAGRLEQVFVNVFINASRAMKGPGTIAVAARRVRESGETEIDVDDDGPGIDPAILPRIFDPFFTTSEEGSGLGLSVVYGIIKAHDGGIEASNRPEGGARLRIRLKTARGAAGVELK